MVWGYGNTRASRGSDHPFALRFDVEQLEHAIILGAHPKCSTFGKAPAGLDLGYDQPFTLPLKSNGAFSIHVARMAFDKLIGHDDFTRAGLA